MNYVFYINWWLNTFVDPNYATNRHWELTQLGVQHLHTPLPGFEFFIMSYNILAQNLLQDNMYLYRESQENVLDWSYRSEKLLLEIRCLKADVNMQYDIRNLECQNDNFYWDAVLLLLSFHWRSVKTRTKILFITKNFGPWMT